MLIFNVLSEPWKTWSSWNPGVYSVFCKEKCSWQQKKWRIEATCQRWAFNEGFVCLRAQRHDIRYWIKADPQDELWQVRGEQFAQRLSIHNHSSARLLYRYSDTSSSKDFIFLSHWFSLSPVPFPALCTVWCSIVFCQTFKKNSFYAQINAVFLFQSFPKTLDGSAEWKVPMLDAIGVNVFTISDDAKTN